MCVLDFSVWAEEEGCRLRCLDAVGTASNGLAQRRGAWLQWLTHFLVP